MLKSVLQTCMVAFSLLVDRARYCLRMAKTIMTGNGKAVVTRRVSKLVLSFSILAATLASGKAWSQTHLAFTSLTVDGSSHTEANSVDDAGDIVGFYVDSKGTEHGFKSAAGKIIPINFPGSTGSRAYGIDLNDFYIVGSYTDSTFTPHGFRLDGSGQFTTIDVPDSAWSRALSVKSDGTIVGAYADKVGVVHAFLDKNGNGTFTTLDFPNAVLTEVNSIVNLRYMAGSFIDSSGREHGIFGAAGKLLNAVNVPGAGLTAANGINDETYMVGYYGKTATEPFHCFLLLGDQFQTIDFPGATDTRCNGIGDTIEIVGRYTDARGSIHGFFAKSD